MFCRLLEAHGTTLFAGNGGVGVNVRRKGASASATRAPVSEFFYGCRISEAASLGCARSRLVSEATSMTASGTKLKDAIRQLTRLELAVVWLTSYLLFTGQIILIIFIAWGMIGRGLGFENLFWPESISDQFAVGLATSLLVGELWILRYVLDERCADMLGSNWWTLFPCRDDQVRKLGTFLLLSWIPSLAAIVLPKLFLRGPPQMAWTMIAGMAVGTVGLTAIFLLVERSGLRKQVQESRVYSFQPGVLLAHMPAERAPIYALVLVELILAVFVTSILANYFPSPVPFLFLLLLVARVRD
jgi:hypothetical protein